MADWMNVPPLYFEGTGRMPARVGLAHPSICPYGAFDAEDGSSVLIAIQNEREWRSFCTYFLEGPGLPQRPGFESNTARVGNRPDVDGAIASMFAALSRAEAAERLSAGNIAFGFVNDLAARPASGSETDTGRHPERRRDDGGPARPAWRWIRRARPRAGDRRALRLHSNRVRRPADAPLGPFRPLREVEQALVRLEKMEAVEVHHRRPMAQRVAGGGAAAVQQAFVRRSAVLPSTRP